MRDIRENQLPAFIAGYSLVILVHLFGLLLMRRVKFQPTNQRILIMHLAFAELTYNLYQLLVYIFHMMGRCDKPSSCNYANAFFFFFLGTTNKFIMIFLVIDRLLDILLHLRYPLYFTEQRVKNVLRAIWLFCGTYATIMVVLIRFNIKGDPLAWVYYTFYVGSDILIFICALITYSFLYIKARRFCAIDNSHRIAGGSSNIKVSNKAKFLLPCLIIATYLVFNITANVMFLYKHFVMKNGYAKSIVSEISHWFWIFGHLSDGVVYIFLQKDVKKKLISIFENKSISIAPA